MGGLLLGIFRVGCKGTKRGTNMDKEEKKRKKLKLMKRELKKKKKRGEKV